MSATGSSADLTPLSEALLDASVCGVGLCLARILLDNLSFKPLANIAIKLPKDSQITRVEEALPSEEEPSKEGVKANELRTKFGTLVNARAELQQKFCEACWRATMYAIMLWVGYEAMGDKEWFFPNVDKSFKQSHNVNVDRSLRLYIVLSVGFYFQLLTYIFIETRRKDFLEMLLHHVITISLIMIAWQFEAVCIGSLIIFVHDVSDPFLEVAKIFNYMRDTRPWADSISTMCFVIFMVIFGISRLGFYPIYIVPAVFNSKETEELYAAQTMLVILEILHIYWFYLILQVAKKAIFQQDLADNREKKSAWNLAEWCALEKQVLVAGTKKNK